MANEQAIFDGSAIQLSLDLIRVATGRSIELDYEVRSVFPTLRRPPERAGGSAATEHWCTPAEVGAILADARMRREELKGRPQAAYTTFIKATEFAVKAAKERYEWLSGNSPMLRMECCSARSVHVIPSQFASVDLPADLKLPGSPGGPPRRATYRDRAGRLCSVSRAFHLWPQAYKVTIYFTKEEVRERRRIQEEKEKQEKNSRPAYRSVEEYRSRSVSWFAAFAKGAVPYPHPTSSYEYDPAVLSAVRQKIQEAEALLLTGRISTRSAPSKTEIDAPARRTVLRLVHSTPGATS